MMPAHVFLSRIVGVEFMARAFTSLTESQQVEEIPISSVIANRSFDVEGSYQ